MSEEAELGEATLRLSTDGNGLRLGIEEAHVAALGLQKNLDAAHDHIKDRFAEKFEHVGVHLFGHDMLQAVGITNGARPILGALSLGINQVAESFGIASGPIGLAVFGLTALAAIGFKVYEGHEKQAEKLAELTKKQAENFKTTHELLTKLEEYSQAVKKTAPELDRLYDATKRLDDLQRGNIAGTTAQAIAAAGRKIEKDREEISTNEALRLMYERLATSTLARAHAHESATKSANEMSAKIRELNTDIAAQNQIISKGTADIKAHAGGYLDAADKATKLKEAAEKATEAEKKASEERKKATAVLLAESNQFAEFQAKTSARIIQIQEVEGVGKLASVKRTYDHMSAEADIAFNHERALILASTSAQATKDSRIAQLHSSSERTMTAISAAENQKRRALLAGMLNTSTTMYASMAQVAVGATNMIVDTAAAGFATMLVQGKSLTDAFKGFFANMAEAIIAEILKMIAKQLILLALETMTGTVGGGGGVMGMAGPMSYRAGGGPVSAGVPYIVGEHGPELFMAGENGTIIPNNKMSDVRGGAGAGGGVVISQSFSITGLDLSSAEMARKMLRTMAAQMRAGAADALTFANATSQQNTLQAGRAYG